MPGQLRALILVLAVTVAGPVQASALRGFEGPTPTEAVALAQADRDHTSYRLPPDKLAKARALHTIEATVAVAAAVWTPLQLLLLLALGGAALMREIARHTTPRRWLQITTFVALLTAATAVLDLPIRIYAHHIGLAYGLSVEHWPAWFGDRAKELALTLLLAALAALAFFAILRRSPARWWLCAWPVAVCFVLAGVFATPYVIDPLFNHFEPLSQSDPGLVTQLERVVQRSGIRIPPERMFLMKASEKYTGSNAYVTGFGPSKRIVVWDTTIEHSSPDEIAFVFAHELGHYALGHVITGTALSCLGLLPLLWLTHLGTGFLARHWGAAWKFRLDSGEPEWTTDLAAIVALLLVVATLSAIAEPVANGVSRRMEHNADVYGQEAVHGIIADPQQTGVLSFQELGAESLDDPTPHPLFDTWFGTHPPIWLRTAFTKVYDPWRPGAAPKYFAKTR